VTTIGPPPELTAHLRRQLTALAAASPITGQRADAATSTATRSTKSQAGQPAKPRAPASGAQRVENLASAIARRITAIDKADPDRRRKAFRVFLESVMLDEWGPQLINDPGFHQLVDNVQAQMETRPDLRELMQEAASRLLAE
jgi:hypothetical protein